MPRPRPQLELREKNCEFNLYQSKILEKVLKFSGKNINLIWIYIEKKLNKKM